MSEKYIHMEVDELALDQGFIDWTYGHNTSKAEEWHKIYTTNPQLEPKVKEAKELVSAIKFNGISKLEEKEETIWANIEQGIETGSGQKARPFSIRRMITVAAIAASLILPLFIFLGDSNKIVRATYGEQLSYSFPDQSKAQLNAGSSLEYNPKQWSNNRELVLKGEAFFEVEKGERFEVVTSNGSVVVLGTSFNVNSRGGLFEVQCLTGKVEVQTTEHTLILNPGEGVRLNQQSKRLEDLATQALDQVDWMGGEHSFSNASLRDVFEEMERQFNVNIAIERSLIDSKFTGYFNSENIDTALYQVCWPMNLEYSKSNERITIGRTGK